MSIRFQNNNQVLNNTLSQFDGFYQPIGKKTNVYKFRKVSGSVYMTKYGELPLNIRSEGLQQNFQVYTGREPITVYWSNSTKITTENNKLIQHIQVGDYETCYLQDSGVQVEKELTQKNLYGKEYTTTFIKYTISLQSNKWIPSEDDIRDYFYVILDEKSKCEKWLEIVNVSPVYNEETNKIQYVDITFETINDKYTSSGKSILDFVQLGAIGEGYAWPKETHLPNGDIQVDVDNQYMDNIRPAETVQYDFTSGAALSSVFTIGRRKSKKVDNNTYEVQTPQLLFVYDLRNPISSQFFFNKPNKNVYIAEMVQPTKSEIWKSYKDSYRGNNRIGEYNILNTKEVLTGLKHNQDRLIKTNPDIHTYTTASKNVFKERNFGTMLRNYDYNPYCYAPKPNPNAQWQVANKYDANDVVVNVGYNDILNISAMQNFYSDVFEYDYSETKKWKLTDTLGILGGIVKFIVGGLDIGWTTSETIADIPNDMCLLIPCISYQDGMAALDSTAPLPLDVFFDDKAQKVLPTSTNVYSSFRFGFTDRIKDTSQVTYRQEGQGGNGIWNTKYIGQTKFEDGTYIFSDHRPFRFNVASTTAYFPTDNNAEFVIDYIDFKAIASCDYKISGFDTYDQPNYYFIGETNGKASGDIRVWGNGMKFNYWEANNTSGEIDYPLNVEPFTPPTTATPVDLDSLGIGTKEHLKNIGGAIITYQYEADYTLNYKEKFVLLDIESPAELKDKVLLTVSKNNGNNMMNPPGDIFFNYMESNWSSTMSDTLSTPKDKVISLTTQTSSTDWWYVSNWEYTIEKKTNGEKIKKIKWVEVKFADGTKIKSEFKGSRTVITRTLSGVYTSQAKGFSGSASSYDKIDQFSIKENDTGKTFDIEVSYEPIQTNFIIDKRIGGRYGTGYDDIEISTEVSYKNLQIKKVYTSKPWKYGEVTESWTRWISYWGLKTEHGSYTEFGTGRDAWNSGLVTEGIPTGWYHTMITDPRLQIVGISLIEYN